jgi:hypothetical protein
MVPNALRRPVGLQGALALCATLALSACASHYAQVPPRLDLQPYGRIALVTFSTEQPNGTLSTLATQRFAEALLRSQSGIELLELGAADSSLKGLPTNADPSAIAQALGRRKDVPAVFLGRLKLSDVKPSARVSGSGTLSVRGSVVAELTVQLLSTRTGGTMWRSSATTDRTVGRVAIGDRLPTIAVRDPSDAYGEVVGELVNYVTRDLRPTLVKQ